MSFLRLRNISKRFDGDTLALNGLTLELPKGQLLGLIGESGSGKSTLLRVAAGLETQDTGEVFLGDMAILNPSQKLVAGYDQIQLVHQQFNLYPHSTVEENIRRPLLLYDKSYAQDRTEYLLEAFSLGSMRKRLPRELSGGQQQKVAIAKALSVEPEVLLFDEPFSHLDPLQKRQLLEEVRDALNELQITGIWVTHDLNDALMLTSQVGVLHTGTLVQYGAAEELLKQPQSRYVAELFSPLNPLPGSQDLFLRPMAIHFSQASEGIKGRVKSCRFLPFFNQLTVSLEDVALDWTVFDNGRGFREGDQVYLKFSGEDVMSLPK